MLFICGQLTPKLEFGEQDRIIRLTSCRKNLHMQSTELSDGEGCACTSVSQMEVFQELGRGELFWANHDRMTENSEPECRRV